MSLNKNKIRLFNIAKELEVGRETLFEHLEKAGFKDLSINSTYSDEMAESLKKLATMRSVPHSKLSFLEQPEEKITSGSVENRDVKTESSRYQDTLAEIAQDAKKLSQDKKDKEAKKLEEIKLQKEIEEKLKTREIKTEKTPEKQADPEEQKIPTVLKKTETQQKQNFPKEKQQKDSQKHDDSRPNDNQQTKPSEQRQGYSRPNDNQQTKPSEQRQGYSRPNDNQPKPSEQRQGYSRPNDNQTKPSEQRQGYSRPNDNQPKPSEQRQGYSRPNDNQQTRPSEQRQGYSRPNDNQQTRPSEQRQGYNRSGQQTRPSEQRQGYNRPNDNQQTRPSEQRQGYNRPNDNQPRPTEQRQGYNRSNDTYSPNRFTQQIIPDFLPQEDGENLVSSTETLKPTSRKYHPESKNKSKEANKYGDKEKAKVHSVKRETKETITSFLKDVSADTENTEDLLTAHKRKKRKKVKVNQANVSASIKETMAKMNELPKRKKYKKEDRFVEEADDEKLIRVSEFISVSELASMMEIDPTQIITNCFKLGLMVSINQRLDFDTINLIAGELGFEVEKAEEYELGEEVEEEDKEEDLLPRPPIVTIMGHVDHGKTSLLDYIRNANVVAGEAGGITQHIGAYEVETSKGHKITFLDTPGHEAFTAMRSRGAQITDIVILVVAADDSVMPQTIEAIQHAQAANVPIVIAINKIDKVGANPEKIKTQLSERGILIEEWGGKYQCIEISAKKGINVDKLLELVALEAEMINLRANPDKSAKGIVIEAKLDKGRGAVATVLITNGTLEIQDPFVCGPIAGRVRAMLDERGNMVENAPPSTPVQILGFEGVPQAGDTFVIVESDKEAREIALKRQQLRRERQFHQNKNITLDQISEKIKTGGIRELRIIIKGDVDGSVEALSDSLIKLGNSEVAVKIILKGVGVITEADVLLASTSGAIILGFQIRPNVKARDLAIKEDVEIRLYKIIYDAINEIRDALEGLLAPTKKEEITALVEVRDTFKVPKIGVIAGCYVLSGKVVRNSKVRVLREDVEIFDGKINSLKRFKDDVKEVATGFECGIGVENFDNLKEKDIFEFYQIVEVKRKL